MKFTFNWLKQYVEFDWSPVQLAEQLTMAGIEVEEVASIGGGLLEQIVVAEILASEKHPNADRLSVCRVTDGKLERQIVCGAKNYKLGDKVPLALPGVTLPGGFTIKAAKLRGVDSQGMMCSAKELALAEDAEGLLILPATTTVGMSLSDALGGADTVFDIEVTPNRPDWLSVVGIARDIAAITGNPLRLPECALAEGTHPTRDLTSVEVTAADLCPRYTARLIRGVTIGPSPAWLRQLLEKVGKRSINNVVDVTNYVMLELGHPLHAFDYNLLAQHRIVVRRAASGEKFAAIDGSQHDLTSEMLVIADADRAVALAGIMGGQNSEINGATTDVLLESAWFQPANIRKTSKALGLSSDSSYRFERGADMGGVIAASDRAAALIQQTAGGDISHGLIDALAKPVQPRRVTCRYAYVNRVLGIDVPPETVARIMTGLGVKVVGADPTQCEVDVPTFRVDVEREADLVEEVCRIHGVGKIPAAMQPSRPAVSSFDARWDELMRIRHLLTGFGFYEAVNQTLVAEGELKLRNPLTAEQCVLRASLVPGLLANLRTNISRHQYDVRLFEIGNVFAADGRESLQLALAATGSRTTAGWDAGRRGEKLDTYDLKGTLDELARQLGILIEAPIREIDDATRKKYDLRDAVHVTELDLEPVLGAPPRNRQFRELAKFPAIERDVALIVDERVTHGEVVSVIDRHRNQLLEQVELFDIFRGGSIPAGSKSMAYALTYRSADRSLTDAEVNAALDEVKRQLQREIACALRDS